MGSGGNSGGAGAAAGGGSLTSPSSSSAAASSSNSSSSSSNSPGPRAPKVEPHTAVLGFLEKFTNDYVALDAPGLVWSEQPSVMSALRYFIDRKQTAVPIVRGGPALQHAETCIGLVDIMDICAGNAYACNSGCAH